jgi:hypothetical protein
VIVEIAACGQARARLRENRRDHLLDRGLAIAAGHAHERDGETHAPCVRGLLERLLRVRNDNLRDRRGLLRIHERAGGAGFHRGVDEIVAVEVRAVQRHEQLTRGERARVGRNAGIRAVGSVEPTAAGMRETP